MKTGFSHATFERGVTLVELIAFIVIVSVIVAGLMAAFSDSLRGTGVSRYVTQAIQMAQERTELILGQKHRLGFTAFNASTYDPCLIAGSPPEACTVIDSRFTVTSSLAINTSTADITVTVTGPDGTNVPIQTRVTDY